MSEMPPVEPGYYANDIRRLSFGEFWRLGPWGFLGAILLYPIRSFLTPELNEGIWLSLTWKELQVDSEELTEECHEALLPQVAALEREGFYVVAYQKAKKHLYPLLTDSGTVFLIHPEEDVAASVSWTSSRLLFPDMGENKLCFTSVFGSFTSGKVISIVDSNKYMDVVPPREIVCLPSASVKQMVSRLRTERERLLSQGEEIEPLGNTSALERFHDEKDALSWQYRVHVRRVMVPMTDAQIEAALRRM